MGSQLEAKLRITAETAQAVGKMRELVKEFDAFNKAGKAGGKAPVVDTAGLKAASQQLAVMRGQASELSGLVGRIFAAAGAVVGLRSLAQMSDTYAGLTARLRIATDSQAQYNQALSAARGLSTDYQQGLEGVARLVTKTYTAIKPLGGSLADATTTTEALLAALKKDGAGAQEAASAVLQFGQALSSGVLRAEEFNAVAEASPSLLDALAKGLGKPRGELKLLGEQGKLTTDQIVIGLSKVLPELRATAAAIPPTIGGGFTVLNNAITEFIGKGAQTSGTARLIAESLKLAADNVALLVGAVSVLAGAGVLVGLGRVAAAIAGVAAVAVGSGGVFAGLLALFGGPVGLVVVLGALAAGWVALRIAQASANEVGLKTMQRERDAVQAQIDALRSRTGRGDLYAGTTEIDALERRAAKLDVRIERLTEQQRALDKTAFLRSEKGDAAGPNLRDPAGLKRLADEYKTAAEISRKFEDDRKQLVAAADKEVAYLRSLGRDAEAVALGQATQARLRVIDKAEREAARKEAPVASRIAQFKAGFDATLELQRDAIARETVLNQQRFDDALTDLQAYLAGRARLEDSAAAQDLAKLNAELAARRNALATNESRVKLAQNPNEAETVSEAVFTQKQEIAKLEVDIAKRTRDQADAAAARLRDAQLLGAELRSQQADIERQLADAQGQALTPEQLRARVMAQFAPQFDRLKQLGGDTAPLLKLVDVETTRAQLEQVKREFDRVSTELGNRERTIAAEVAAGKTTEADAEVRVLALRAQQVPVLDAILERMRALVQTADERNAIDALIAQIAGLKDFRTELEKTARSQGISAISTALTDIATGAKTGKEALLDMVSGFAKAMLDVLNRRLAEQLVDQFIKAIGSGSGSSGGSGWMAAIGSFIASLFHSGGVVGGGGGVGRAVNPAVFAFAPRFHGGGIAGLRPRERAAILEVGEEVLTQDNPRHISNAGRMGGISFVSNVEISGAQGSDESLKRAGDDLVRQQRATFDAWLADTMRPGGMLARR